MASKKLGKRIQLAREEAGLNQEQMASLMGCSQPTLSNYEKGKSRIYLAQLKKVAEILDKPLNYFLEAMDDGVKDGRPQRVLLRLAPEHSGSQVTLKTDREIADIVAALCDLPEDRRRAVMEFILWEKDRNRNK